MKITENTTLQDVVDGVKVTYRPEDAEKEGYVYADWNVEICSRSSLSGEALCRSSISENQIWVRLKNSRFGEYGLRAFKIRLDEELDTQKIREAVSSLNDLSKSQYERGAVIDAEIESAKAKLFYIIGRFAHAGYLVQIHSRGENTPPDGIFVPISEAEKIVTLLSDT